MSDLYGEREEQTYEGIWPSLNKFLLVLILVTLTIPIAYSFMPGVAQITKVKAQIARFGLANVVAGLEEGITTFDASLGGLGGCPFAPGASGNIVTEDLALMLHAMGYDTGIDLDALLAVRAIIVAALPGEPLYGFTPDAGLPLGLRERLA